EAISKGPVDDSVREEILGQYLKAIQLRPDYADAYFGLSQYYGHCGKEKEAMEAIKKTLSLKPDHVEALCALGFARLENKYAEGRKLPVTEKQATEAIELFKRATQIKPDDAVAYTGLGMAYSHLGKYNEALEAFGQAIHLDPANFMARLAVANIYV